MKKLFYVRTATLTLFEAYPDDPKTGWMAGRECLGSTHLEYNVGKHDSIESLLAYISPNDTYYHISKWEVSNVDDGGFLLNLDVIVDHNKRAPSPDRIKAWKEGRPCTPVPRLLFLRREGSAYREYSRRRTEKTY